MRGNGTEYRRNGIKITFAALILLVVLLTWAWFTSPPDPLYNGKRLSEYLHTLSYPGLVVPAGAKADPVAMRALWEAYLRSRKEAEEAVRTLGPQAIPLLQFWWQSDSAIRGKLRKVASAPGSWLAFLLRWRNLEMDRRQVAFGALKQLVPQYGVPMLPLLRKEIIAGGDAAPWAADLLGTILEALPEDESRRLARANADLIEVFTTHTNLLNGSPVQALSVLFRHNPPDDPEAMARRLWPYHQRGSNILPTIAELDAEGLIRNTLFLESGNADEKPPAVVYFIDSPRMPERIVPLLASNLASTNTILVRYSCEALAAYGTNATVALPLLRNLMAHPKRSVVEAASNAVTRISGNSWRVP